jgi:hypothetical protein
MNFLGWERPILHSAADWLLDPRHVAGAPDLSNLLIAVRGRRAGRRLLELLALRCAQAGTVLVPPEIVTGSALVGRLTRMEDNQLERADSMACVLAWAQAIAEVSPVDRDALFRRPGPSTEAAPFHQLVGLGQHLYQVWSELGGAGISFQKVMQTLAERFPNIADFEIPRWQAIEHLHQLAARILSDHGLVDPTDLLMQRARNATLATHRRVILVGVPELPRLVVEFLRKLPASPEALVFAPETERAGFDDLGLLNPGYWVEKGVELNDKQIHIVERDQDQATRAAHLVASFHGAGLAADQMTIGVPEAASLPKLRETIEAQGLATRTAQGRPLGDSPAFQFLRHVGAYLNHLPEEPPTFESVAALARHPDFELFQPKWWPVLDQFAADHLPARFAVAPVEGVPRPLLYLNDSLLTNFDIDAGENNPERVAKWVLALLDKVYGYRKEHTQSPEGRLAVKGLESLSEALKQTIDGWLPWPATVRPADFLAVLLRLLGAQPVPEPADASAVQLVGWLELVEDDVPAVIVTSFHGGAIPESISADPFLPASLRKALALADNSMRLARDAFALQAIVQSRSQGRGAVALIAPRFDAGENPTRPSRLLLSGLHQEELARRVWHLAGRRAPDGRPNIAGGSGLNAAAVDPSRSVDRVRVTGFRSYLESPRKFYFEHVLKLRAESDDVSELGGAEIGSLLHEVLAKFGEDTQLRQSSDRNEIEGFVLAELDRLVASRFGKWAVPIVEVQIVEVKRRLLGFARAQANLRREGWEIRYVEGDVRLECELPADASPGTLKVTGKIDRMDFHPATQQWRIIDYKTAARAADPERTHRRRSGEWLDLQLPLYLKLAAPHASQQWGVTLTPQNCELVYFQLPDDENGCRISTPFPAEFVEEGWTVASQLAGKILNREFSANPALDAQRNDPALLGLCGQVGLTLPPENEPGEEVHYA